MRTALMSLRNQERGLYQINEAMSRAQGRQSSIAHLLESGYDDLQELYQHLRGERLPGHPDQKQTKKLTTRKRMMRIHERITE